MKVGVRFISILFSCSLSVLGQQSQASQADAAQSGPKSPIVSPDGRVTFNLRAPGANTVLVSGDYPVGQTRLMAKGEDGVWSITVGPMREDIYAYRFLVDGVPTLDPQNVFITRDGTKYQNWAYVAGPKSSNYVIGDVPHGRLIDLWYPSPALKMTRRMLVYTPPGYEKDTTRYPVLYLLNGGGGDEEEWTNMGRTPEILDNLIAKGKVTPMIVVMANGHYWQTASPNKLTATPNPVQLPFDITKRWDTYSEIVTRYADSVVPDLVPFVDKSFRTITDRDHRAIAGLSMGGAQTADIALKNLNTFSWVGLLSSAVPLLPKVGKTIPIPDDQANRRGPGLGQTIDIEKFAEQYPAIKPKLNRQLHLLYLGVGKVDGLLEADHDLQAVFYKHGVKYVNGDMEDFGHDWNYWRFALADFATLLFKQQNRQVSPR